MSSPTDKSQEATPQILSRSAVQLLSQGLDASDILECYALVRPAPLHNSMMSDATMTIHKVAIGLRYRPLTLNEEEENEGKVREITLEYGPQRMGVSLSQESTPLVQHENGGSPDVNTTDNEASRAFVTWENEGKVYYTTDIASTGYISAYYMASVTGAVLEKILEKAVEYPLENVASRGRPKRYQPFVVVDGTNSLPPPGYEGEIPPKRKVLLKSSGSSDFLTYMWYTLAELGVSLQPILKPPNFEVQLVATGVEKVKVGPPAWVTQSAASFYEKLYKCIEAKVTGDYSRYAKPTQLPTASLLPSQINEKNNTQNNLNGPTMRQRLLRGDLSGPLKDLETPLPMHAIRNFEELAVNNTMINFGEASNATGAPSVSEALSTSVPSLPAVDSIMPSAAPTAAAAATKKSDVEEAQQAASEAQQAATQAKDAAKSEKDSMAADAAQVAANAAQKAADSSQKAAASAQAAALMSGDGAAVTGVVAPCFNDPQFGIASQDENGTVTAQAFLYMDGSSYYRVNLTYPFVQVAQVDLTLPQPRDFAGPSEGGDFVDWSLAIFLFGLTIFAGLLLVQQVCGGYVKVVKPLFEFQRWFFNPLHHVEDVQQEIEEEMISAARLGGGQEHSFGLDAIPISMGGKRPSTPRRFGRQSNNFYSESHTKGWTPLNGSHGYEDDSESSYDGREIEMVESQTTSNTDLHSRAASRERADSSDSASSYANVDQMDGSSRSTDLPPRFARDPSLVDMPNLKSSSKVAVPVGVKGVGQHQSSGSTESSHFNS